MQITKGKALDIAKQNLSQLFKIDITDVWDARWKIYGSSAWSNCWYIMLSPTFTNVMGSQYLMVVSKDTGQVLYSGSANDEG